MTHISATTRSRRVAARPTASNVSSSCNGTFSLLRSHRREAYSNAKQCIYLTACFFHRCSYRNYICAASLPTTTSSPPLFLLGSAALFVNPQLAYFHDGHLLLINKAETFHLKGKREWGGGVGAGIAANATCLGESLSGAELQCFLSPAAAGYQVDVGPLDVSISLFMRWCIPSRGARRLVYVAHFRAFAELTAHCSRESICLSAAV